MTGLLQDIRYALRQLRKSPGFTGVAILSLALGIGANTAIFSLVNGILLSSLPVPNPQQLRVLEWSGKEGRFTVTGSFRGDSGNSISYPVFQSLREQCAAQADIFGYINLHEVTVRARHEAVVTQGLMVSSNFFSALGVQPYLGRIFSSQDEQDGAAYAAVISYTWWQRQFDSDPNVLGQGLQLNGQTFTVVGVLPRDFRGEHPGAETEFYVTTAAQPLLMKQFSRTSRQHWWVAMMARLRPGVADQQLQSVLNVVFAREAQADLKEPKIVVSEGRAGPLEYKEFYRKPLMLLSATVALVLLVACVNLAGLLLARAATRQHEFAVRSSIGAGRWRLIRQPLLESILITLLGSAVGIVFALWGKTVVASLLSASPDGLRYDTSIDGRVLGFTLLIALVTALLAGLLPALRAGHVSPVLGLKERGGIQAPRLRVGRILVAAQIAVSFLLLAGAGLFARTLVNFVKINPGFQMDQLVLFQLAPENAGYTEARSTELFDSMQRSLSAIPSVNSVTVSQYALLDGWMSGGQYFTVPGHAVPDPGPDMGLPPIDSAHRLAVSETFFDTMGIPLLLGRKLTEADAERAPKVVVINEAFARKYFPGENPVGQVIREKRDGSTWTIAGVCGNAKYTNIRIDTPPTAYYSFRQTPISAAYFVMRTKLPLETVIPAARKIVTTADPRLPLSKISTQVQLRNRNLREQTLFSSLCGALAFLAVLLSCVGLMGLMSYNVARRTGEIGVRMAFGATPRGISRPILREAALLAAAGLCLGTPAALVLTRCVKAQLYGVTPNDPLTLVAAGVTLIMVAMLAAWIPARRAAKVDPMVALRYE